MKQVPFIPMTRQELGGKQPDFILVCGDAYVDHPSFGHAIAGRYLQSLGYTVGMIAQPDWHSCADFMRLGRPRLAFIAAAGNIDSMVNHYTAAKKRRSEDYYSPGKKAGLRPDRATIVYCNRIREAYDHAPIIIAGIEASLRRFAHYDYWDDAVRRSILVDSGADLLIYGMAEHAMEAVSKRLAQGERLGRIHGVAGTCYLSDEKPADAIEIESFEQVKADKRAYAKCFGTQYVQQDPIRGKTLVQKHGAQYLVAEKPAMPLTTAELDALSRLPYNRTWHPSYDADGGVPAIEEVKFSITANRGCYGECAFCALTFHQGRIVQARSTESIVEEAKLLTQLPDFKGYIHDIGGPTANFSGPACDKQLQHGACANRRCLSPKPCPNLKVDHTPYLRTLAAVRSLPGVKKVFVRSGVRFDYAMLDRSDRFLRELVEYHVSGQLKVAPEHVSPNVLNLMGKPNCEVFTAFCAKYDQINQKLGKKQFMVPYFMSSHPGSTLNDAVTLALYMRDHHIRPEQVQDFYPTPGTRATCMYHTGLDPLTLKPVYVPKTYEEKRMQRALLQYTRPENQALVRKALTLCGREDLIGYGRQCLVPPPRRPGRDAKFPERVGGSDALGKSAKSRSGARSDKAQSARTHAARTPADAKAAGQGTKKAYGMPAKTQKRAGKATGHDGLNRPANRPEKNSADAKNRRHPSGAVKSGAKSVVSKKDSGSVSSRKPAPNSSKGRR